MSHAFTRKTLKALRPLWEATQGAPAESLLRLHLLRQTSHTLHAERSRLIANDLLDEDRQLAQDEQAIEALRIHSKMLEDYLPPSFLQSLGAQKILHRMDRKWELALVCEAHRIHWKFWKLTTQIKLTELARWQESLGQILWPRGVLLWTESAEQQLQSPARAPALEPSKVTQDSVQSTWTGCWYIALESAMDPQTIAISTLAGWNENSPVHWQIAVQ